MAVDHNNPQSRDEEILIATIDGKEYNKAPQSRMEELLLELKETIEEGGGGGGTTNYNNLSNQPQVNGETLIGDKTGAELGLVDAEEGKGLSTNDYDDTEKAAVAAATLAISAMKDGSEIDSFGDVEVALLDKADISDLGTAAAKDSTNSVTAGSTDLVESGAVKDAIDAAVSSAYHHAGTKTVAQLTHDLLIAANEGNVYNITDSGTTTSDFIEGIGKQIDAGDNVGICKVGNIYMFDLLSGLEDTSIFVQKSQTSGLLNNDGTVNTTIEDTVAGHTAAIATKQPITDNTLQTTDKTIPGAINEVKSGLNNLWSLGGGNSIANNTDLDNITTVGNYYAISNTAATLLHCPTTGAFKLKVLYDVRETAPTYIEQVFNPMSSYDEYRRYKSGTAEWSDWHLTNCNLDEIKSGLNNANSNISTLSNIVNGITYGSTANPLNIDTISGMYYYLCCNDGGLSGDLPITLLGGGSTFLLIGFSHNVTYGYGYGVQIAIDFTDSSIAIRNSAYNSGSWGAWRKIASSAS